MKFITIWYPTIFHKEPTPLKLDEPTIKFEIDDNSTFPYWCTLEYAEYETSEKVISHCIKCKSEITKKDKSQDTFTVTFYNQSISRNGFAVYWCDENKIPEQYRNHFFTEDVLLKPIYHKIKEFFHSHEADSEKDSVLIARCSEQIDKKNSIDAIDNVPLIGFLENFETMFCNSVNTISNLNSLIQEKIKKYENNSYKLELLIKATQDLNALCENALIEYTYCKTLLTSIYNQSFRHDVDIELNKRLVNEINEKKKIEERIEYRRKALNIRNAVRYIENIKYKNQNRQDYILKEILKGGERTQVISLILGITGISYAFIFGYKDEIQKLMWFNCYQWWSVFVWGVGVISISFLFVNMRFYLRKLANILLKKLGIKK